MRIFDVTNLNSGVENIAIRVGETGNYEKSSLKYWGSILDLPSTYCQLDVEWVYCYQNTLFVWCKEFYYTVRDIVDLIDSDSKVIVLNYISEYDKNTRNHEHTVESKLKESLDDNVVDIKSANNKFTIYVFKDNCRTNVLDKSVNDDDVNKVKFYEC